MIRLIREARLADDTARRFYCLREPGYRVYAMELDGLTYDASVLGNAKGTAGFLHELTVCLDGEWIDRRLGTRSLHSGDVLQAHRSPTLTDRWEPGLRLLTFEWEDLTGSASAATVDVGRVAPRTVERCWTFVQRLAHEEDAGPLERELVDLTAALRAEGYAVPSPRLLPTPSRVREIAAFLNRALSGLHAMPTLVDFTAARSERQLRRDFEQLTSWLGLIEGSWRTTLHTVRLQYASALVTARQARVADVAAALGYRSDRALIQAMQRAGLPSPSEIRRRVRRA